MKKITLQIIVFFILVANYVTATTYTWTTNASCDWTVPTAWTASGINTGNYPNAVGDVIVLPTPDTENNTAITIWPSPSEALTIGEIEVTTSNHYWIGEDYAPVIIFNNSNKNAKITVDRKCTVPWFGLGFWGNLLIVLSNDLEIITTDENCSTVWIEDNVRIVDEGEHSIIKSGAGFIFIGGQNNNEYYLPRIEISKPIVVNDGYLCIFPKVQLKSFVQVNEFGSFEGLGSDAIDIDIELNGGIYSASFSDWTYYTNLGRVTVLKPSQLRSASNVTHSCNLFLEGNLCGTSSLYKSWSGTVNIVGNISPGISSNDIAVFELGNYANDGFNIGLPDNHARLIIEIDGIGDLCGTDNDMLKFSHINNVDLGNIDVSIIVGINNPDITNIILKSEFPMQGEFSSITWNPKNATGTVVYSTNTVAITDLVPEPEFIWIIGLIFLIEALKY